MALQFPFRWKSNILYQGEQWPEWEFTLKDKNGEDITTYDVEIVVFRDGKTPSVELILVPDSGLVKTGATTYIDTKVLKADTSQFAPGVYMIETRIIIGNGKVYKMTQGQITITKSLTNA